MEESPEIDVDEDSELKFIKYPIIHHIFIAKTVKMNKSIFLIYVIKFNLPLIIYFRKINKKDNIVNIKNTSIGTKINEYEVSSNKKLKSTVQTKKNFVLSKDSITLDNIKTSNGNREYMYIAG